MATRNAEPLGTGRDVGLITLLSSPDLPVDLVRSAPELAKASEHTADRGLLERLLCDVFAERESWTHHGVCRVCEQAVEFSADWRYSYGGTVNFREQLVCPRCKLNNRLRFMAHVLLATTRAEPPLGPTYLYEQVTPFFAWAHRALPRTVIGSEYLGPDVAGGVTVRDVRHEDALALSFDDASLGTIISNDVFEHVADIDRCFEECVRVLRPGGRLYFSVPFDGRAETIRRATVRDGRVAHLMPPRYHRNPLDPNGSLVFYDYGWDVIERCRVAGFADAYALGYWSLLYGHLGARLQLMFVAEAHH
jgi:hypothetical protein